MTNDYGVSGVYEIECTATGQKYIGSSEIVVLRIKQHLSLLTRGTHPNRNLQNVVRQHGMESIKVRYIKTWNGIRWDFAALKMMRDMERSLIQKCQADKLLNHYKMNFNQAAYAVAHRKKKIA
jgi:GIY-YIG catalytic domain